MAIDFIPELWEKEVQRLMPTYGSLFANGLVMVDNSPMFKAGGGNFHYSRYLKSLAFLGDDNKRNSTGDITAKTLSYGELQGVIIRRYDAIKQQNLDVIISGVDGLKSVAPQIAQRNTANIEKRFADILLGLFRHGGALKTTHSYDYTGLGTGGKMDEFAIINAQALYGRDSAQLTKMIVHSKVYADMLTRGIVGMPQFTQGQSVATSGQLIGFVGKQFIQDDDLCAQLPAATGIAVAATTVVTSVTISDGGEGYTAAPTVTFSGGGGTGAAGTAVLTNGKVTSVTMTNNGTGYTTPPTVTFAATGVYPSFLAAGQPFYLGYQRDMQMKFIENLLEQNITQTLRWDLDYCPHVINTSYVDTTPNPATSGLVTAANWASAADHVTDIKIIRILTK